MTAKELKEKYKELLEEGKEESSFSIIHLLREVLEHLEEKERPLKIYKNQRFDKQ